MGMGGEKGLLRLITCGSVDDGKSTLLGRLLLETGSAFEEELAAAGEDLSLLVDGLEAEREQGITIDVAYRFFATPRRKFIVADAPGHEQYTRNLVTGASTADLAIMLVDARKGLLTQTRRHGFLVQLLGVRALLLAVNKMDMVGYDQAVFDRIAADFAGVAGHFTAIPVSALEGDNVAARSAAMPWYEGPSLLEHLESVEPEEDHGAGGPFRMPVQWVIREGDHRGFGGMIACRPAPPLRWTGSSSARKRNIAASPANRSRSPSSRRSIARAATCSRRRTRRPRWRTSSRRRSSGWVTRTCCRAANMG
jgi:bifunctional enzyme CysN/CysC